MADIPSLLKRLAEPVPIPGLTTPGNINLNDRPVVTNIPGRSISTVRSMSFGTKEGEVLVPTVSDDGRIMTNDEAKNQYYQTGRMLGIFDTPDNATAYAHQLHQDQAALYRQPLVDRLLGLSMPWNQKR